MKHFLTVCALIAIAGVQLLAQTYNPLWIPDTLSGKEFNLTIESGHEQWFGPNHNVMTAGFNPQTTGKHFWGPTLIMRKGDTVRMNVINNLTDTTTVHWHGMHLPAVMDGGPNQPIAPGSDWKPYWKVANNAATYWYHPHLHMMAQEQLLMGLGGMIIVRDTAEDALALPRTYGVDDIPLALSDRAFTADSQISIEPYGDSMQVNGVIRAEFTVPRQVVRFRILNSATERSYNLGFSDNRKFSVIASDGGLLSAPVELTRYLLSAGERIEILVNFSSDSGKTIRLRAFNANLPQSIPGGDRIPNSVFTNALARIDFDILRLNVGNPTANAITAIPAQLVTVNALKEADAFVVRKLTISDTTIAGNAGTSFVLNKRLFNIDSIDYRVGLNNTEIWEIANSGNFAHPFHIHDVQFNVLTRNGQAPQAQERGWKDVVLVRARETVRFIAKFEDFADSVNPYMFHCHIALHEDEGMMGQFVVVDNGNTPTITFMSTPVVTAREGTAYKYTARASSNITGTITYQLVSGPTGLAIDGATGAVSWAAPVIGKYSVVLSASITVEGKAYETRQTYTLTVTAPLKVEFTSTPVLTGTEGTPYSYTVRARCSDTTRFLTYRIVDSAAGMTLSRQGQLAWAQPKAGVYTIAVRATVVGDTVNAIQRYTLTITASTPTTITFSSTPPTSGVEKVPYTYQVSATCSDTSKTLTFTLRDTIVGMSLTKTGLLEWPSPTIGTYPITIRAKVAGDTIVADQKFTLTIIADSTTSVNDDVSAIEGVRLYPLPASGSVTIEFATPAVNAATITITDLQGCQVLSSTIPAGQASHMIDTRVLSNGMYLVRVEAVGAVKYLPVLIQR